MTQKFKIGDRVSYTEQDENGTTIKLGVVVSPPYGYTWAVEPGIVWVQLDKDDADDPVWFSESDLNSGVEIIPDAMEDQDRVIAEKMIDVVRDTLLWDFNITTYNSDSSIEFINFKN